jgi:hypothetical protein
MDIVNFFEKVEGTWFSQRTTHQIADQRSQTGQITLEIAPIAPDGRAVADLCHRCEAHPDQAVAALQISPENGPTALLVVLKGDRPDGGIFLSQSNGEAPTQGQYTLADEVLTLTHETDGLRAQERLWYLNPNLRMRTCLVDQPDGTQLATFCSEIRRGVTRAAS